MKKNMIILISVNIIILFLYQKLLFSKVNNNYNENKRPMESRTSIGRKFGYSTLEQTFSWFLNDYIPLSFSIRYNRIEKFPYGKKISSLSYELGNITYFKRGNKIYTVPLSLNIGFSAAKFTEYKLDPYISIGFSYLPIFYGDINEFEWNKFGFNFNFGLSSPISKIFSLGIDYKKFQSFRKPNLLFSSNLKFSSINFALSYYPSRDEGHYTQDKKLSIGLNGGIEWNYLPSGKFGTSGGIFGEYRFSKSSIIVKYKTYGDGIDGYDFSILLPSGGHLLFPIYMGPCIAKFNDKLKIGSYLEIPLFPVFPYYAYSYEIIFKQGVMILLNNDKQDPMPVIIQTNLLLEFKFTI